jgi:hypothetical protein
VSVDVEWSKDHVSAIGLKLSYYVWILMLDNLRPGGAIRGSVEPSEGKGGERAMAIPRFSMW